MRKHAKDEQIPKRRLWPAATTVVVVAVAAASVIALAGARGGVCLLRTQPTTPRSSWPPFPP